ncbi:Glutaredoxin-C6 [Porphyridium purpureum]|uniref:Glutaredoxin-C6 n=1 Tax=Porphyridium purpureum TaxID=35688 RepID=A0A5J4YTJ0_PORPP|nr:Glutaredoxin-C6 [Porphyridium purpureum]|eukprot:POR8434..scf229_5
MAFVASGGARGVGKGGALLAGKNVCGSMLTRTEQSRVQPPGGRVRMAMGMAWEKAKAGTPKAFVEDTVVNSKAKVVMFTKTRCPYCINVRNLFTDMGVTFDDIDLSTMENGGAIQNALLELTGQRTVPNVFIRGAHVGGCDDTLELQRTGALEKMLG